MVGVFNVNLQVVDDMFQDKIQVIDMINFLGLKYTALYVETGFTPEGEFKDIELRALKNTEAHEFWTRTV